MGKVRKGGLIATTAIIAVWLNAGSANAGSFQINERSTKALGAALSGSSSAASDVTFSSFNPAALSVVENFEAGGNLSGILLQSEANTVSGPFVGSSEDGGRDAIVPAMALGYRLTDDLVIGLSTYSPFGLKSSFEQTPFIFDAATSELRTVSISPTVSYEILDNLAIGASVDVLYADARLTNAGLQLDGDTWSVGFSVGLLFEPIEGTQIGAAYHHGYDLDIDTRVFGAAIPGNFAGTASASLPNWFQVGVTQSIDDEWRVMVEGRYINWSRFDSIDIETGVLPTFSEIQGYDDAFFVSIGTEYDVTDQFTLRGGVAFDNTPTNDQFRTIRVADEDRMWIAVGASYSLTESMTVDFAYNYLFAFENPRVTALNAPATVYEFDTSAHIFSIGGTIRF